MLSDHKPNETGPQPASSPLTATQETYGPTAAPRPKATPSILSADLTISGNIRTPGDVQIEGIVEGDIRAAHLIVGQTATISGEVVAEEVVVNGRVVGRVRGLKVRLSGSARVEGDIIHKMIAIENGAHFEGSVQRQENPVDQSQAQPARIGGAR
jgi:cytoskeletal protein CcmA (bactofilin family)